MLDRKTNEELYESLQESFTDILTILKALGTANRLKIMITLLEGTKTFQELMEAVEIGRTALANHLAFLKEVLLIDKIHHGYYRITQKGLEFLQAIDNANEQSQTIEAKEKEALQRKQLLETFLHRKKD